jgi:cytochrome c-type biogenesis protein CcmH/NrfF
MRLIFIFLIFSFNVYALSPERHLQDPAQEQRAMKLFSQVKCLVCAGQSVESSNTEFSYEMRKLIRAKIAEGKNDNEVKTELVKEFGDSVLLSSEENLLLWMLPFIFAGLLWVMLRKYRVGARHAVPVQRSDNNL